MDDFTSAKLFSDRITLVPVQDCDLNRQTKPGDLAFASSGR